MVDILHKLLACIVAFMSISSASIISFSIFSDVAHAYQEHGFIEIDGDSEFLTDDSVIGGNGSAENPYLISGWHINGSYNFGIHIKNTRAFVVLSDVAIENSVFAAIKLENVSNARIENSILSSNLGSGINLLGVRNLTILNCTILDVGGTAILGNLIDNALIEGITAREMDKGIYFDDSLAITIRGCVLEDAAASLLSMSRCASSNIEDSMMRNSKSKGLELIFVNSTRFFGNAIVNASIGIYMFNCNLLVFHNNAICVSRVSDLESISSFVRWNVTYAEGGGNYWSSYIGFDAYNGPSQDKPGPDGIIDIPFTIQPGNIDAYPLLMLNPPYIDYLPPISNAGIIGEPVAGGWYKSFAIVAINATDDLSGIQTITYAIDSSAYIEYRGSFKISESGVHIIRYYATDRMSNQESEKSLVVKVDSTPPVTKINIQGTKGQGDWYLSSLIVILNATDNESGVDLTWYSIDASATALYTSPIIVTSEGYHNIVAYSIDIVGNSGPIDIAQASVDRDPPELAINEANGSVFTSLPVAITWTASDSVSGLDHIEISIDGGSLTRLPATRNQHLITGLSDGSHVLSLFAFDKAGHITERQMSFRTDTGALGILMSNMSTILAMIILLAVVIFALIVRSRRRRRR